MDKENKSEIRINAYSFTPEELGLERLVIDGHRYIDVTPLWIDSKKSREVYAIIEAKMAASNPENVERKKRKGAGKK